MRVLVVNAGSSSLKLRLLGAGDELRRARVDLAPGERRRRPALDGARRRRRGRAPRRPRRRALPRAGRDRRRTSTRRCAALTDARAAAPADVAGGARRGARRAARACRRSPASTPRSTPRCRPRRATYALPARVARALGAAALRLPRPLARVARRARRAAAPAARGSSSATSARGASLAAVRDGRSVDTTMGFTPLEGSSMATRSGSVDPGAAPVAARAHGLTAERELADGARARVGPARAGRDGATCARSSRPRRAARRPRRSRSTSTSTACAAAIAAMAAALGGLDVLVFTGGVGERAPEVRAARGRGARLPRRRARRATATPRGPRTSAPRGAVARTLVVEAREDLEIARGVRAVLR